MVKLLYGLLPYLPTQRGERRGRRSEPHWIFEWMALHEKQSIRENSRRTGLSRNTIAKSLSAGTIEPTFTVPERSSNLDPFADKLAAWLKTNTEKSRKQ